MADRTVDLAELRQRFAEQIDEAASWGWPSATVAIRVDEAQAIAAALGRAERDKMAEAAARRIVNQWVSRAERVEAAARNLDGAVAAHWIGSEFRYAEGRLWAAVNDARERFRAALDEGAAGELAAHRFPDSQELRWRRAEADILRAEIERLNAENAALRQRLQDKNEILHAYAGPAGMTPEDVAYALEEHVRVMRAVRALEQSLQGYDIAGDDVLAEERDLFIAAGVWPKAREIGWSEEESDD